MPDFTYESYARCTSVEASEIEVSSSRGGTHKVALEPDGRGGYEWRCPCDGYYYRKHCSHVDEALNANCGWDSFLDGGSVTRGIAGEPLCPECGGPATYATWAV